MGLLSKVEEIRKNLSLQWGQPSEKGLENTGPDAEDKHPDLGDDEDWGIDGNYSDEEKTQILLEINGVLEQNRMRVDQDTFTIHPQKKGWIFPLVVNGLALTLVIAAFLGLTFLLSKNESQGVENQETLLLTEARLLEEVRKESENLISQKDLELDTIRKQMEDIEAQKLELQQNFEANLAQYKENITQNLLDEIEAEKERLRAEGYAEEEINRRLAQFREQKEEEVQILLTREEQRLAAEKTAREEALQNLRGQYEGELDLINQEKEALEASYQSRIREMQEELENSQNATAEELTLAQKELNQLSNQQEEEERIRNQVSGFYASIQESIRKLDYTEARETLELFRDYIDGPSYNSVDSIASEKSMDTFLVSTLEQYLSILDSDQGEQPQVAVDLERISRFNQYAEEAHNLVNTGNWDQALAQYRLAMDQLPEDYEKDNLLERIMLIGWENQKALAQEQQTLQTGEILAQADTLQNQGDNDGAASLLADLFNNYPFSRDNARTGEKIKALYQSLLEKNSREREAENREKEERINSLESTIKEQDQNLSEMSVNIENMEADLRGKEEALSLLEADDSAEQLIGVTSELESLQQETARLQKMEILYNSLNQSYRSYAEKEDQLFSDGITDERLVTGKAELNRFLNESEVQEVFPGLGDRIKLYDQAFESAGQEGITLELADLVFIYSTLRSDEERLSWIEEQRNNYDSEEMQEFLDSLEMLSF